MVQSLRIAIADDEPDVRDYFERILPRLGHQVACVAEDGHRLVEQCRTARPDLVLADIRLPGLDGIAAAETLWREAPVAVVFVTGHDDEETLRRAEAFPALAYLVKPVTDRQLGPAIAMASRRFAEWQALSKETANLRQALEDRKLVERAKGVIIKRLDLVEAEAFRRLQKLASDKNRKLVDVARTVLEADQPFQALEDDAVALSPRYSGGHSNADNRREHPRRPRV
jgi:response regulator NasT